MSILIWTPQLKVNIEEIDIQHQKLLDLANIFYKNLYNHAASQEINDSFNELMDYTVFHFKYEENTMREKRDPNIDKHIKEHADFINDLNNIGKAANAGKVKVSVELIEFLRNGIINHIFTTDKEMANYLIKLN
jgi:hemerythrin-like metal-binding protein